MPDKYFLYKNHIIEHVSLLKSRHFYQLVPKVRVDDIPIQKCDTIDELRESTIPYFSCRYNICIYRAVKVLPMETLIKDGTLDDIFWKARLIGSFDSWFFKLVAKREGELIGYLNDYSRKSLALSCLLRFKSGIEFVKQNKIKLDCPVWFYTFAKYDHPNGVKLRINRLTKWGIKINPRWLVYKFDDADIVDCPALFNITKYLLQGKKFKINNYLQLVAACDGLGTIFAIYSHYLGACDASFREHIYMFELGPDYATRKLLLQLHDLEPLLEGFRETLATTPKICTKWKLNPVFRRLEARSIPVLDQIAQFFPATLEKIYLRYKLTRR